MTEPKFETAAVTAAKAIDHVADDHSEGMSFLSTLPQRVVRVYMPLSLIVVVPSETPRKGKFRRAASFTARRSSSPPRFTITGTVVPACTTCFSMVPLARATSSITA